MSIAKPVMNAQIVDAEEIRLRNGKRCVSVSLDRSHAEIVCFQAPVQMDRPVHARKRRKRGLPEHNFYGMETWLVPLDSPPRQLRGSFGFVDPITAPARFSFVDEIAVDILIGSQLELRMVLKETNERNKK